MADHGFTTTFATARTAALAAALTATLGLAAAFWGIAVWQMHGMDMGVATRLGSFASFIAVWVVMMAAMMLPGPPRSDRLVGAQNAQIRSSTPVDKRQSSVGQIGGHVRPWRCANQQPAWGLLRKGQGMLLLTSWADLLVATAAGP